MFSLLTFQIIREQTIFYELLSCTLYRVENGTINTWITLWSVRILIHFMYYVRARVSLPLMRGMHELTEKVILKTGYRGGCDYVHILY